ncbi:MAG: hypothetical protein ACLQQB_11535 [Solirubrobacteraceae bacterium]|jgi:hypothetical protein
MRRASTCLVVLGLAVLGLSATASAAPTITLKGEAVPIPGYPHTGNILGAGTALKSVFTISGTEYGGFPAPLVGVKFYGPAGSKVSPQGFATCTPATIEQSGPALCPKASVAGPKGSANGVVSFGTERVSETLTVQPFFAPGGNLEFFADGTSPVSIELLSKGSIVNSSPPFGPTVLASVPLVETVPGALDGSAKEISVVVGAAYKKGGKTHYYLTVPKKCPKGGFPLKAVMEFGNVSNPKEPGEKAEASFKAPCPKK